MFSPCLVWFRLVRVRKTSSFGFQYLFNQYKHWWKLYKVITFTAGDGQTSGFGAISSERYLVLVATNSAVNVPISCEKCLFLATTNKAGNSPECPLKYLVLLPETQLEMSNVHLCTLYQVHYAKVIMVESLWHGQTWIFLSFAEKKSPLNIISWRLGRDLSYSQSPRLLLPPWSNKRV